MTETSWPPPLHNSFLSCFKLDFNYSTKYLLFADCQTVVGILSLGLAVNRHRAPAVNTFLYYWHGLFNPWIMISSKTLPYRDSNFQPFPPFLKPYLGQRISRFSEPDLGVVPQPAQNLYPPVSEKCESVKKNLAFFLPVFGVVAQPAQDSYSTLV